MVIEIILGALIVGIILYIFGIDIRPVVLPFFLWAAVIFFGAMAVFFVVFGVTLIFSKRKKGVFSRVDKWGKTNIDRAWYIVDGVEYPNIFPCEVALRELFYHEGKEVSLLFLGKSGKVIDFNAVSCIILGIIFCSGIFAAALSIALV